MATSRAVNIYSEKEDCIEIDIYGRRNVYRGTVSISKEHESMIRGYNWSIFKSRKVYYAHSHVGDGEYLKMHRLIAERVFGSSDKSVDHINRDGLDNRLNNLRYATNSEQGHNKGMFSHNTSGVKGVSYQSRVSKWRAEIHHRKKKFTKLFFDFDDAVKQRKLWERMIENGEMI